MKSKLGLWLTGATTGAWLCCAAAALCLTLVASPSPAFAEDGWAFHVDCYPSGGPGKESTANDITVEIHFRSGGGANLGMVPDCGAMSDATWQFGMADGMEFSHITIKTSGDDAFFIDEAYLSKSGEVLKRWGIDNDQGWCLSQDLMDANAWKGHVESCEKAWVFSFTDDRPIGLPTVIPLDSPPGGFRNGRFERTHNAAISGHNQETLSGNSVSGCATACLNRDWCRSFDYDKANTKCDLSDKTASDVGGLKTDYNDNPYDYYERIGTSEKPSIDRFSFHRNAAIAGHNEKRVKGNVERCAQACLDHGWCNSFDYDKKEEACDLSKKRYDETGLKTDYAGQRYDHYSRK